MRAWNSAFRRASFRGVPFWVEEDGPEKGRRVSLQPVSGGETVFTEDMGKAATQFRVSAYLVSDYADMEGMALEAACIAPGPAPLILPMDMSLSAHCLSCRRNRSRDRNGYIAYDLTFAEAGGMASFAAAGLGAVRAVFSAGVSAAAGAISKAFS